MAPTLPAQTDDGAARRGALARRLVELRETGLGRPVKGLALASAVGTSKHSLWEWEHGRHIPREQALDALARFFAQGIPRQPKRSGASCSAFEPRLFGNCRTRPPNYRRAVAERQRRRSVPPTLPPSIRSSSGSTPGSFASGTWRLVTSSLRLLPLVMITNRPAGET